MQHAASAITAPDTDKLPVYWQFHEAVTRAQLTEWLPTEPTPEEKAIDPLDAVRNEEKLKLWIPLSPVK